MRIYNTPVRCRGPGSHKAGPPSTLWADDRYPPPLPSITTNHHTPPRLHCAQARPSLHPNVCGNLWLCGASLLHKPTNLVPGVRDRSFNLTIGQDFWMNRHTAGTVYPSWVDFSYWSTDTDNKCDLNFKESNRDLYFFNKNWGSTENNFSNADF